jgi:Flp pilus assembly protein TadB
MAQAKKKRRRKHRGTQGGRVDANRRAARPRSRAEAKARARSGAKRAPRAQRGDNPPTWRSSILRGLFAAAIFTVLLMLIFKRPIGSALALGAFMLVFYIPAGYYIDMYMWRRRERARIRASNRS